MQFESVAAEYSALQTDVSAVRQSITSWVTSSTGMPAMTEAGSSTAAEFTCTQARSSQPCHALSNNMGLSLHICRVQGTAISRALMAAGQQQGQCRCWAGPGTAHSVICADDHHNICVREGAIDFIHLLYNVVGHPRLCQQHIQLPWHAPGHRMDPKAAAAQAAQVSCTRHA